MPTDHILTLLIAERDKLNKAIEALSGPTKRRGRPPKNTAATDYSDPTMPEWVKPAAAKKPARKKARTWTAAQKRAAAERMKARWAVKNKGAAKATRKAKKTA